VGLRVCRTLFRYWRLLRSDTPARNGDRGESHHDARGTRRQEEEEEEDAELEERLDYTMYPQTRVVIREATQGSCALLSKTIDEWDGTETSSLPQWMVRSIERGFPVNERGEHAGEAPKIGPSVSRLFIQRAWDFDADCIYTHVWGGILRCFFWGAQEIYIFTELMHRCLE
jgi:hypothetical protein